MIKRILDNKYESNDELEKTSASSDNSTTEDDPLVHQMNLYRETSIIITTSQNPNRCLNENIPFDNDFQITKRISCHKCGNIRKATYFCPNKTCPHIFCFKCVDKSKQQHGIRAFNEGCPVCLNYCCCSNKTINCRYKYHCYRKCPMSKLKVIKSDKFENELKSDSSESESNINKTLINKIMERNDSILAAEVLCNLCEVQAEIPNKKDYSNDETKIISSGVNVNQDELNFRYNQGEISQKSLYVSTENIDAFVKSSTFNLSKQTYINVIYSPYKKTRTDL